MKIAAFLGKLFNVRPGEWPRLLLLYTMSLVALIGLTWGDAIVQAAFLQRVGVQYLPWVFIVSAACSIAGVFIYTAFADRVSNTRLLIGLLAVSGAGILLGLAALAAGMVRLAYPMLYLVLNVPLLDLYNVHWATYINGFYDIRAAKRIVPVLGTAECLSGIIAGLSMPLMNRLFSPAAIIVIMVFVLVVMAALAAAMPRILHEHRASQPKAEVLAVKEPPPSAGIGLKSLLRGYGTNLREGYQQIARSPFLVWMALSTLSMTILLALLNYGASAIFLAKLQTTVAISDYIGVLSGVANLVVLPIQLFLLSRLISRVGLGNASLIYPFGTLAAVGSLAIAPGLGTAGAAYLDRTALRNAFRLPTDNLLYNAVPQRVKARTRAFIGGLLVPGGAVLGGLLLLTPLMHVSWFLPAAMVLLGLIFALGALMVRRHYGRALLDLLEQEDYSTLVLQPSSMQELSSLSNNPAHLALLAQKLSESTSPERTVFIAQLIATVGGEAGVPIVASAIRAETNSRLRVSLIEVLVATNLRGANARKLYRELLDDPDPQVRLSAIGGLEQIGGPRDRRFLEVAASLLTDPENEVRLRVLPVLITAYDPRLHAAGTAELRGLLNSPDPHTRTRALQVVGLTHDLGFLTELVRALTDPVDEVRLAAALATEALAGDELMTGKRDMMLVLALLLLHDPIERARVAAVTILDRLSADGGAGASAARESLAAALADPSQEVCEQAVEALVRAGRRVIPLLNEQLASVDLLLRKMSAVVLSRIEPGKYGSLVLGDILDHNLNSIYQNLSCIQALTHCPGQVVSVLASEIREQNSALFKELFYLLSTVRDPSAINRIASSLQGLDSEVRANAAEALESLTCPKTAALIAPLLDPDQSPEQLLLLARQTWDISIPTPFAAMHLLLSDSSNEWHRTLASAALAELSESVDSASQAEIGEQLTLAQADPDAGVRAEAKLAPAGFMVEGGKRAKQPGRLTLVEKLVLIKDVSFFQGMTVDQLRILANVCEEEIYPADSRLYTEGDPGGVLYVVVSGRVGLEHEKYKGSFARVATIDAGSFLGETNFFDNNCCSNSAIAIQETRTLRLRREPLIALARQYPDLSLKLINGLSVRLREANEHIAELTRTHPQILNKLFDQLSEAA